MQKEIINFLTKIPPLNQIEAEADIPLGVISKAIRGRRELREAHIEKLMPVLKKYGFKKSVKKK